MERDITRRGNAQVVPLRLDDARAVEISVLAAIEANAANSRRFRGHLRGVLVAWHLGELAAVLHNAEADAFHCDFVIWRGMGVGGTVVCIKVCHVGAQPLEVFAQLDLLPIVPLLESELPSLFYSACALLALLFVYGRVDQLQVAICFRDP